MEDEVGSPVALASDEEQGPRGGKMKGLTPRQIRVYTAGGVRDKVTMAEMKARISALYRDCVLFKDIAAKINDEFNLEGEERISVHAITYHIKNLIDHWKAVGLYNLDEKKAFILARYSQLEDILTEAYFASCLGTNVEYYERQVTKVQSKDREAYSRELIAKEIAEAKKEKRKPDFLGLRDLANTLIITDEKIKEYRRTEENLAGDPRWMEQLIKINDKRAEIFGLKGKNAVPEAGEIEAARLSDEKRGERLVAIINSAIQRKTQDTGQLAPAAPLGGDIPIPVKPEEEIYGGPLTDD